MNIGNVPELVDDVASKSTERKLVRVRVPSFPLKVPGKRWNDSMMIEAVKNSASVAQVLKCLGLRATGANYLTVKRHVKRLELPTSHWTGLATNRGVNHQGGSKKLLSSEVLVLDRRNGYKEAISRLRRALLDSGVKEICSECGLEPLWNEKSLRLQIDHKNGNPLDNRPGNPRFICPNCHSQTANYGSLNIQRVVRNGPLAKRKTRRI